MARGGCNNRKKRSNIEGGGDGSEGSQSGDNARGRNVRVEVISPLKLRDVNLPTFDGSNDALWVLQVKPHLISMQLKEFIMDLSTIKALQSFITTRPTKDYKELDQVVMEVLLRSLKPNILPRVLGVNQAKVVWRMLEMEFKGSDRIRSPYLELASNNYKEKKMKEWEVIIDFYTRFITSVNKLKDYGEILQLEKVNKKMLRSLSKEFKSIVVLLQNHDAIEMMPFQELLGKLRSFE